ncbi:two-component system phosphate regulon sensor histidine kinase PhoR [Bradyrhizobium sp. AZCC 2262]|uniref:sensor histidine kinase n=1 Tax=Bradyrhizobium sp. AZCC 2262 TaxID=3117022 RepID=UPI002FF33D67
MHDMSDHNGTEERNDSLRATAGVTRPVCWNMTTTAAPHGISNFETVLLAIAGYDLRQPLQVIQSAHELLGLGIRTGSELRYLRSGQSAIDRLKDQLEQILSALRFRERAGRVELTPVRVHQVLRQACRENQQAALRKGVSIHMVSTNATILSDGLLLGAALRNLVSNAIKYTQPGGRVLLGCRHSRLGVRIDVYDTGTGIPGEQIPKIFEAFTRLDAAQCDGLGIGLFIVRNALGILGHRIDVASTPCRGSRFSIFVARGKKREQTRASKGPHSPSE